MSDELTSNNAIVTSLKQDIQNLLNLFNSNQAKIDLLDGENNTLNTPLYESESKKLFDLLNIKKSGLESLSKKNNASLSLQGFESLDSSRKAK